MAITTLSLLVPAAFAGTAVASAKDTEIGVLNLSHGTAIVLLIVYGLSLFFQVCKESHLAAFSSSSFVSQLIHVFVSLAQDPPSPGKHQAIVNPPSPNIDVALISISCSMMMVMRVRMMKKSPKLQ